MPRPRYASDARRRGIPFEQPSEAQQRLTDLMGDNPEAYDEWVQTQTAPTHEMNPDHFQSFLDERIRKAGGTVAPRKEPVITDVAMPQGNMNFTRDTQQPVQRPHVTFDLPGQPKQEAMPPTPPQPMPTPPPPQRQPIPQPQLNVYGKPLTQEPKAVVPLQYRTMPKGKDWYNQTFVRSPYEGNYTWSPEDLDKILREHRRLFTATLPAEVDLTRDEQGLYKNVPNSIKAQRDPERYMAKMAKAREEAIAQRNRVARVLAHSSKEAQTGKHWETGLPLLPEHIEQRKHIVKRMKDLLPYIGERDGKVIALPYGRVSPPKGFVTPKKEARQEGIEAPTFEKAFSSIASQPSLIDLSASSYQHPESGQNVRYGDVVQDLSKTVKQMRTMLTGDKRFKKQSEESGIYENRYFDLMSTDKGRFKTKEERQRWNELRAQYEKDRRHLQAIRSKEGILDFDDNIRRNYGALRQRYLSSTGNQRAEYKRQIELYNKLYPEIRSIFSSQEPLPDDIMRSLVEMMGGGVVETTDGEGNKKFKVKDPDDYTKLQAILDAYPQAAHYLRIYSSPATIAEGGNHDALKQFGTPLQTEVGPIQYRFKMPRAHGPSLYNGMKQYEAALLKNLGRDFVEPDPEEPIPIPENPLDWSKGENQPMMGSLSEKIENVFNDYYTTPDMLGANLRKTLDRFRGKELTHGEQMERNEAIAEYIRGIDQYNSVVENRPGQTDPKLKTWTDRSHRRHNIPEDLLSLVRGIDTSDMKKYRDTKERLSALNGQLRTLMNEHERILSLGKVNGMTTPLSDTNQQALNEVIQQIDEKRNEIERAEGYIRELGTVVQDDLHERFSTLTPIELEEMLPRKLREPFKKDVHALMESGIPMMDAIKMYDVPGLGEEPHITQDEFIMIKNARKEVLRKHHLSGISDDMVPTQDELNRYRDLVNGEPVKPGEELSEESLNKIVAFLPKINAYQDALSKPSPGEAHMLGTMSQADRDTLPEFERTLELQKKPAEQLTPEDEAELERYNEELAKHIARNRTNSSVIDAMDRLAAKDDRDFDQMTEDEFASMPDWAKQQITFLRKMGDADNKTYAESMEPDTQEEAPIKVGEGMSEKDIPQPQDTLTTEEDRLIRAQSEETKQALEYLSMPTVARKIDTSLKELQSAANSPYLLKKFKKPEERIEYASQHMPEKWYENTPTWVNPVFKEIYEGNKQDMGLSEFGEYLTESWFNKNFRQTRLPGGFRTGYYGQKFGPKRQWDTEGNKGTIVEYRGANYIVLPRQYGLGPLRISGSKDNDPDVIMTREYADILKNMAELASDLSSSMRGSAEARKILYDIKAVYDKLPAECRGWRKSSGSQESEEYAKLAEENERSRQLRRG
jgi:hypothetical protein